MTVFTSPSPTGDLDESTIARFRRGDTLLEYDRHRAGLPELVECDGDDDGIAQRVADDFADDTGVSYAPVNGSSHPERFVWLCPACTAQEAA
jgi:hypothetical protein